MSKEVNFEVSQTALAVIENSVIEANFEEVKAALTEMVAPYAAMVVTADSIADAKADRAKIRKVAARVDEVRKTIKAQYQKPLADFEAKCKELVAICNEGSDNLDRQVKAFEEADAEAKVAAIKAVYDADPRTEAKQYRPWESIYNPKWANKTYKAEDAKEEVRAALFYTETDLQSIRQMGGENTAYLLTVYKDTRDINACIRKALEIGAAQEREERRRREEEERKAEASLREPERNERLTETAEKIDLVTISFKVTCTTVQLNELGQWMRKRGIKYGRA